MYIENKPISKTYYINGQKCYYWKAIDEDTLERLDEKSTDNYDSYKYDRKNCSSRYNLCTIYPRAGVGLIGPPGPAGIQGLIGAQGPAGGLSAFAYIYSTQAQSVSNAGAVLFNNPATIAAPISFTASSSIITLSPGSYFISFGVSVGNVGSSTWGINVNSEIAQRFSYTSISGNSQVWGEAVITILITSSISIVNNSGGGSINLVNSIALTSNTSVSASVTILKLN